MEAVILGGARTPFGRLQGMMGGLTAAQLGGIAIRGALERAEVDPRKVDYVIMGHVLQAGAGQNPARTAAWEGGIPITVPAVTVNKVCLSGLNAIAQAAQLVALGEADVVVAGGMESMTRAPHLLPGLRRGVKYGDATILDHMAHDGLTDVRTGADMGSLTESWYDDHPPLSRQEQDAFALRSHQRAAEAAESGLLAEEIVPVEVTIGRERIVVDRDENVRADASTESLARLRPAFRAGGTITAGTSSPISDGAAAVVVMSRAKAEKLGIRWLARIGAHGMVAATDTRFQLTPAGAIRRALAKAGLRSTDLDLVEINEAFAAVGIESARELGIDLQRVNLHGGAIAIGHPLGASGARIALHLALELSRRGGGTGAAALCGGGGQGEALVLSA